MTPIFGENKRIRRIPAEPIVPKVIIQPLTFPQLGSRVSTSEGPGTVKGLWLSDKNPNEVEAYTIRLDNGKIIWHLVRDIAKI